MLKKLQLIICLIFLLVIVSACSDNTKELTPLVEETLRQDEREQLLKKDANENAWDNWIYFGSLDSQNIIYGVSIDGSETRVLGRGVVAGIHPMTEWIYYKDADSLYEEGQIKRSKWDGSVEETIIVALVKEYVILESWIFYEYDNKIYRANLDGSNVEVILVLSSNLYQLGATESEIIFGIENGIYKMSLDGHNPEQISTAYAKFDIYDGHIYYPKNHQMYRYDPNTRREAKIHEKVNYELYIKDNQLYYNDDNYLISKNLLTGDERKLFLATYSYNFKDINGSIYCMGDNYIFKIDKGFKKKQIIYGLGLEDEKNLLLAYEDKIIYRMRTFDVLAGQYSYIYEMENNKQRKLLEVPVGMIQLKGDWLYYINQLDQALYKYNLKTTENLLLAQDVAEFCGKDDQLYVTSAKESYHLKTINDLEETKIIAENIYNIKCHQDNIFYLSREGYNRLYRYDTKVSKTTLEIDRFIFQYTFLDDYIYYRNDDDEGRLYRKKIGSTKEEQLTEYMVKYLHQDNGHVYYILENGGSLLYQISNNDRTGVFLKFMPYNLNDFLIIEGKLYESSDIEDEMMSLNEISFDDVLGLYRDGKLMINEYADNEYIAFFEGYLYHYNKERGSLRLIADSQVSKYYIKEDWIYFAGGTRDEYRAFIKRVNLKDMVEESLVLAPKAYTAGYEFLVNGKDIFYMLPDEAYGYNLIRHQISTKKEWVLVEDSEKLLALYKDGILYAGEDGSIQRIDVEGKKKEYIVKEDAEFIALVEDQLYYFQYTSDAFDGKIVSLNLMTKEIQQRTSEDIKLWEFVLQKNRLYYNLRGIHSLDLNTGKLDTIYHQKARGFYLEEEHIVVYPIHQENVYRIPLEQGDNEL